MKTKSSTDLTPAAARPESSWEIEMFHDGDCPLCSREVEVLKRLDRSGKIRFVDIAATDFDASKYDQGLDQLMSEMHVRLRDGTWLRGVEAFRRLYDAVGYRRLVKVTRLPVVSGALELGYRVFAKNRLRLTGRCDSAGERCSARDESFGLAGRRGVLRHNARELARVVAREKGGAAS